MGKLGLAKRGKLRNGYHASICVVDAASIASYVTARHPRRYASCIAHVMVNGQIFNVYGQRMSVNACQIVREFAA